MIVDTHVHVIADDPERYPIRRPAAAEGLTFQWYDDAPVNAEMMLALMGEAGVDATVLVQPMSCYQFDNRYVADSVRAYPAAFAGVCIIRMGVEDSAETLGRWVEGEGIAGMRVFVTGVRDPWWLDDPKSYPVWERARDLGVPVCMQMPIAHIPRLRNLLERFPEVTVAIDHLASLHVEEQPAFEAARPLIGLDKYPNVHLKFSTMNLYGWANEGEGVAHDFLERLVERFGPGRLMWGSNFPATYDRPYHEMVDLARESLAFLSEGERREIMGGTALKLWPRLAG